MFKFIEEFPERIRIRHEAWPDAPHDFGELTRDGGLNYNWWPPSGMETGGYWNSCMLKAIADKLEELNKPIDDEYNKWCEEHESTT